MVSGFGGSRHTDEENGFTLGVLSFAARHAESENFKALFKEGMGLVEEAAAYLDGTGRQESKTLSRPIAIAYASESMRLTTRLMQTASWLLLRRAVAEGEMTPQQAASEKHRVRLTLHETSASTEMLKQLPPAFVAICEKSLRLQSRILRLAKAADTDPGLCAVDQPTAVSRQLSQLQAAFPAGATV